MSEIIKVKRIFQKLAEEEHKIRSKYAGKEEYADEEAGELAELYNKFDKKFKKHGLEVKLYDVDEDFIESTQYCSWYIIRSTYIVTVKSTGKRYRAKTKIDKFDYNGYIEYANPRCDVWEDDEDP